jgi:NADPH:quinone reductase-like Zn-dependent oxidoreductase
VVKEEGQWYKVRNDVPMEYAATVTVNPLTAIRMLEDFVKLNSGVCFLFTIIAFMTPLIVAIS